MQCITNSSKMVCLICFKNWVKKKKKIQAHTERAGVHECETALTIKRGCVYLEAGAEKINQKINKTLKSLQSTERDAAATSRFLAQKDSLVLVSDPPKYSAGAQTHTEHTHTHTEHHVSQCSVCAQTLLVCNTFSWSVLCILEIC